MCNLKGIEKAKMMMNEKVNLMNEKVNCSIKLEDDDIQLERNKTPKQVSFISVTLASEASYFRKFKTRYLNHR